MAFYFALLNVSTKREDRPVPTSSHRQKRRRHSIASVESPVLDYRLLPKPQVVRSEFYHGEPESSRQHEQPRKEHHQSGQSRSASSSRQNPGTREPGGRRSGSRIPKGRAQYKGMRKSDSHLVNSSRRAKQKTEAGHSPHSRQTKAPERTVDLDYGMMEREFGGMQVASSSRRTEPESQKKMNGSAVEHVALRAGGAFVNSEFERRWKGKKPIVVKRRVSPQESSTSDSRRSSNQSNRSPQRNDSLASSNSSRRTSEAVPEVTSPLSLPNNNMHKLSNLSMPPSIGDLPRSSTLKKVTFENDNSQCFVDRSFLGDRRVLVRRGSGSAILRRSVAQQALSPPTTIRPFAAGATALAGLAFGAALWAPLSGESEVSPRRQNVTNNAIEQTTTRKGAGSLLRRRSTSDRHVVFGFHNEGFRLVNDETPQNDMSRTISGATLVPFVG